MSPDDHRSRLCLPGGPRARRGKDIADRVDFYFRQRVTEAELDLAFALLEKADRELAADLNIYGIVSGAVPAPHSPVPDLTVDLTAPGRAYDNLGQRMFFGTGQRLGKDWFERLPGLPMYFYDADSVQREFGPYGLIEHSEINEPTGDGATLPFIYVVCRRDAVTVHAAQAVERLRAGQVEVTVEGSLQQSEVEAIAEALATSESSILTMGGCKITDAGGVAIAHAMLANTALRELWLFNNEIDDMGSKALGDALRPNGSLTTLCLNENRVGDVGATAIGQALRASDSLVELGLGRNRIGDVGAAAIGEALASNRSVIALSLNHNQIGDAGAVRLGEALRANASLRILRLSHNAIGNSGAQAVQNGIAHNSALRTVSFDENPASPSFHEGIKAALERER